MPADAKVFAEKWFTKLLHRLENGEVVTERTLGDVYKAFIHWHEYDLPLTGASNATKSRTTNPYGTASSRSWGTLD